MQIFISISSLLFVAAAFIISDPMESRFYSFGALMLALSGVIIGEIRSARDKEREIDNG